VYWYVENLTHQSGRDWAFKEGVEVILRGLLQIDVSQGDAKYMVRFVNPWICSRPTGTANKNTTAMVAAASHLPADAM
jgi:hypothetical protein